MYLNKSITLIILSLALNACSSRHDHVYHYEKNNTKAYLTDKTDSFEVKHYKKHANTNVLVIDDIESLLDSERKSSVDDLCTEYEMNCNRLDLSNFTAETVSKAIEFFNKYPNEYFLLMTPNKRLAAKYLGLVNLLDHEGDDASIKKILLGLGVEDSDLVLEEINQIKESL